MGALKPSASLHSSNDLPPVSLNCPTSDIWKHSLCKTKKIKILLYGSQYSIWIIWWKTKSDLWFEKWRFHVEIPTLYQSIDRPTILDIMHFYKSSIIFYCIGPMIGEGCSLTWSNFFFSSNATNDWEMYSKVHRTTIRKVKWI